MSVFQAFKCPKPNYTYIYKH
uniref:Uncharacterized protein n=1 Tax=Medicago truncatula TaxID=3880 RepID=I3T736_MEDTR|nr:unknown [Medicago truncatula]